MRFTGKKTPKIVGLKFYSHVPEQTEINSESISPESISPASPANCLF